MRKIPNSVKMLNVWKKVFLSCINAKKDHRQISEEELPKTPTGMELIIYLFNAFPTVQLLDNDRNALLFKEWHHTFDPCIVTKEPPYDYLPEKETPCDWLPEKKPPDDCFFFWSPSK